MHCNSCIALIKMELEENNLDQVIADIRLIEDNVGEIDFTQEISAISIEQVKDIINSMPNYQVV